MLTFTRACVSSVEKVGGEEVTELEGLTGDVAEFARSSSVSPDGGFGKEMTCNVEDGRIGRRG